MSRRTGARRDSPGTGPAEGGSSRPSFLRRFARHRAGMVGALTLFAFVLLSLLAPLIRPYDPLSADMSSVLRWPSAAHWLGTDEIGRDVLSRLLYGGQLSLRVGALAVIVGVGLGVPLGCLSGYAGGTVDLLIQRVVDVLQAFPGILLVLLVSASVGPNLEWTVVALGILSVPAFARLVRGSVLLVKELSYVEAAHAAGVGSFRVVARHILPNSLTPVIVQSSLQFGFSVLLLAGLGFLGLGAQPPTPEWGSMLASGRIYMRTAPHVVLFPALAISFVVLSMNLVGDALRDALDPHSEV